MPEFMKVEPGIRYLVCEMYTGWLIFCWAAVMCKRIPLSLSGMECLIFKIFKWNFKAFFGIQFATYIPSFWPISVFKRFFSQKTYNLYTRFLKIWPYPFHGKAYWFFISKLIMFKSFFPGWKCNSQLPCKSLCRLTQE